MRTINAVVDVFGWVLAILGEALKTALYGLAFASIAIVIVRFFWLTS